MTAAGTAAALGSVVGGALGDRLRVRLAIVSGGLALAATFGAASMAGTFTAFTLAFAGSGLVAGLCLPAVNRAVITAFDVSERGIAMGTKQAAVSLLGGAAAAAIATLSVDFGLSTALATVGVLALVTAPVAALGIPDRGVGAPTMGVSSLARILPSTRNQRALAIATLFMAAAQSAFTAYLVLYLMYRGIPPVQGAVALTLAYTGGAFGRLGWGAISDLALAGRRRAPLFAVAALTATTSITLAAAPAEASVWVAFALVTVPGLAVFGWYGLALTALGEAGGAGRISSSIGRGLTLGFAGQAAGPILFGTLVDLTGGYLASWMMLSVWGALAALLILFLREA